MSPIDPPRSFNNLLPVVSFRSATVNRPLSSTMRMPGAVLCNGFIVVDDRMSSFQLIHAERADRDRHTGLLSGTTHAPYHDGDQRGEHERAEADLPMALHLIAQLRVEPCHSEDQALPTQPAVARGRDHE